MIFRHIYQFILWVRIDIIYKGKAEDIIFLLAQKGSVSPETELKIRGEKDSVILNKWLLLATNAERAASFETLI